MFNLIDKVKEVNPLVLHYTNNVTITTCYDQQLPAKKLISENTTLADYSFSFFYPN